MYCFAFLKSASHCLFFRFILFFLLFNLFYTLYICENHGYRLFNITSDVLSYAHQLLFYVTLPCKHSSILPVLLWMLPFSIIRHRVEPLDRRVEVQFVYVLHWTKWKHSWTICGSWGLADTLTLSLVLSVVESWSRGVAAGLWLLMPCHSSGRCFMACSGTVPLHLQWLPVQGQRRCILRWLLEETERKEHYYVVLHP